MPFEIDAPHLAPGDLEAAGQHRADRAPAGRGRRRRSSRRRRRSRSGAVAGVDDDRGGSGRRPAIGAISSDAGHHDVVESLADALDPLDDQAEVVERRDQRRRRRVGERGEVAQPDSGTRTAVPQSLRTASGTGRRSRCRPRMSAMLVAHQRAAGRCRSRRRSPSTPRGRCRPPRRRPGRPCRSRRARSSRCPSRSGSPSPRQIVQVISNSADGSVNGKYAGPQPRVDVGAEVAPW